MELRNENLFVLLDEDKIFAQDISTGYHIPSIHTESIIGLKNAKKEIVSGFSDDWKLNRIKNIIANRGLKFQEYSIMKD